jgi:hypothetical protein
MPPASPSSHDTLARTNEYEVTTVVKGPFLVARCRGRYTDALLDVMQKQVFMQMRPMAIDAAGLSGVTMPFARAAYYTAQALKSQGHALVLINPPDSVRGFIKLLGAEGRIPILLSESQLPAKVADIAQAAEKLEKELQQIRGPPRGRAAGLAHLDLAAGPREGLAPPHLRLPELHSEYAPLQRQGRA